MRISYLILLSAALLCSCLSRHDRDIRSAVAAQIGLYPELTLTDLYKSFSQAEFGAGHIVPDTAQAGRYLDYELSIPDSSEVLFEPIGLDGSYYRVHLACVQNGYISRAQLFDAFLGGVYEVPFSQITNWKQTWAHIVSVIDGMNLELPGYSEDRVMIDSLLESGHYAVHHSERFNKKYNPHYRIVRGDIFKSRLLPYLGNR